MRRHLAAIVVAAIAIGGAACADATETTTTTRSATTRPAGFDPTGSWELISGTVDDRPFPLVAGYPVTMDVEAGRIGGTSACNDYGGRLVVENGRVSAAVTESNAAACEPAAVMESEIAFGAALARVTTGAIGGDGLELSGDGVLLQFSRRAELAFDAITDRDWALTTIVAGSGLETPAEGSPRLLLASDGTLTGTTGCRTLTGHFIATATEVRITDLAADGECGPDLQAQDSAVISVIEGFTAAVEDGRLVLTARGNEALIYVEP